MLTLVPLVALSLALGQDAKLEIGQPHGTYGYLGARRTPGTGALPGDVRHYTFDIKNLKLDGQGRAAYSMAVEVLDSDGEVLFRQQPRNAVAQNFFGGNSLPCSSSLDVPIHAKPGHYTWKITIKDRHSDQSATLQGKGKIRPADFGLVQVATFADREGRVPMPPVGVVGSSLFLHFATVGFERAAKDGKEKLPNIKVALRVLDESKQPTFAEPLQGHVHADVPGDVQSVPLQFGLTMNRAGRFTLELSARDEISGKTDQVTLPLKILDAE